MATPSPAPAGQPFLRFAVVLAGFLCGATATLDMDFHWHLALGQGVVAQGFPVAEPFSHLPAGVPDRQAWLSDVLFAVLHRIGGVPAIRIVLGIAFAAGCLSVFRLARRRTRSVALALVPLAVYFALAMARLRARPDLFTLALLPIFAELLDRPPTWRRALDLLIVAALWANLHPGSLIAGLLALAQIWPLARLRFVNAAATWVGLCLTPEGIFGLVGYASDTTVLRRLIPEWQTISERPFAEFAPEWAVIAGLAIACVAAAWVARASRARPAAAGVDAGARTRDLLRAIVGFLLAASALRFLFALVLPALWAVAILDGVAVRRAQLRAAALIASLAAFAAFPVLHLKDVASGIRASGWSWLGSDPPWFPVEAADYLSASGLTGNLAHRASWGGYLAWRLAPRFKTATDGRVTHFGAEIAREWSEGIDSEAREEIFARRGIDLVIIPRTMLPQFRDDQPYQALGGDSFAIVLLRFGGPHDAENRAVLKEAERQKRNR